MQGPGVTARLVADGHNQQQGIECDETCSLIVKPNATHIVLSLTVSRHWLIHQLDVKKIFLHSHIQEIIYMNYLPRFHDPRHSNHVCHIQLSLYTLK